MRTTFVVALVGLVAFACDKKDQAKPQATEPPPAKNAAPPKPPPKTATAKSVPSPEQRAEYRKQLKQGRARGKTKQWKEAVRSFEAALIAIPNDGRALSELGWVAFQAGDYERAAAANAASVKYAAKAKVKAASLYNLGRVEEAKGNKGAAAKHYQASLRLRPGNKTVAKRLDQLGANKPEVGEFDGALSNCTESVPRADLCKCETSEFSVPDEDRPEEEVDFECDVAESGVPGIAYVNMEGSEYREEYSATHLAVKNADGTWRQSASITFGYGGRGHSETWDIVKTEKRAVGDREVLWIEVSAAISDVWWDTEEEYSETITYVVLCTLPEVTCGHRFPIAGQVSTSAVDEDLAPVGKPDESEFRAELTLAPEGTATLRLVSGERMAGVEGFLGTHKLW